MSSSALRRRRASTLSRHSQSSPLHAEQLETRAMLAADSGLLEGELASGDFLLEDVYPGSDPYQIYEAISFGYAELDGVAYFAGIDSPNSYSLWKTDGTTAGTEQVVAMPSYYDIRALKTVGNLLFFEADLTGTSYELFVTDGTAEGTVQLTDFATLNNFYSFNMTAVGDTVFFVADDGVSGVELWKTDGTELGTMLVDDLSPGSDSSRIVHLTASGDLLYFQTYDPLYVDVELWRSDGTAAGTFEIGVDLLDTSFLTDFGGVLYFTADDGMHGEELWKTDGTEAGTMLALDLLPGDTYSDLNDLVSVDGAIYFTDTDGDIWKTDGTAQGVVQLTDQDYEPGYISPHFVFQGELYYSLFTFDGVELWKTTDISTEPQFVGLLNDDLFSTFYDPPYAIIGDALFFTADDPDYGVELWKSDGTVEGTVVVTDLDPIRGNSYPFALTLFDDYLLFVARDPANGFEPRSLSLQSPPVAAIQLPKSSADGLSIELSALGTYDYKDAVADLLFEWDLDGDGQYDDAIGIQPAALLSSLTLPSVWEIGLKVTDLDGETGFATLSVSTEATNLAVDEPAIEVNDGMLATNSGVYFEAYDRTVALSASVGTVVDNGDGTWSWSYLTESNDIGSSAVTIYADNGFQSSETTFFLTVNYANPAIAVSPQSPEFVIRGEDAFAFGTYEVGAAPIASITASRGTVTDHGDGTWSWTGSISGDLSDFIVLQLTITDANNVSTSIYPPLYIIDSVNAYLTINDAAATTDSLGVVDVLPDDLETINEWDPFTVNVWIERDPNASYGLDTINYKLDYNDAWFQWTSSAAGASFGQLDVTDVGGQLEISASNFYDPIGGDGDYLLIGSFRFTPNPDGGLPNDAVGQYAEPVDLGFSIADMTVTNDYFANIPGMQSGGPTTQVEVIPYDLDDDGVIGLVDLANWIRTVGDNVAATPESYPFDFDQDGVVSLIDLAYLIRNIGATRSNGVEIQLPPISPPAGSLIESEFPSLQSQTADLTPSFLLEAEAIDPQQQNVDAAFGAFDLLDDCWQLPTDADEEVEETLEEEGLFSAESWRPQQLPDWALEAASIVECFVDQAIALLEEYDEEHPAMAEASDWWNNRFRRF
ncbi:ELWxxDGT repeat protein [Blastopirellula retiformator]|uniref:Dockerin type I repeat protein n=1 Tax=Blastopirellula retiformator TaxID=2527970 RepID=A0A5C5VKQ5_9BACT|nr:ELWxxDGT repeat protein [Blastopirellula retiformator]TWT38583.1 hypothetical protein Enr8_02760 [Blastopirellula retiformator]